MAETAIDIQKLSKRYGKTPVFALEDLSLQVQSGEVYGFLGPNGAGKSTAIRLLMNFIQPTAGTATILGKNIVSDSVEVKKSIGYLTSDAGTYKKMSGRRYLTYLNELQPASSKKYKDELIKRFKADIDKKLGDLSRGNRQKINIIQAFMHQPKILILDEPTSGLDPLMQEEFYALIKESKQRGATIFTSSHIMSEVQKMCDRVGIIREGKLVSESRISDLSLEAAQTFDVTFASTPPLAKLKSIEGVKSVTHEGNRVTLHLHGKLNPLLKELANHEVLAIDTQQLDLEEIFMGFYQDKAVKK